MRERETKSWRLAFAVLAAGLVSCSPASESPRAPALPLEPCRLEGGVEAQCGTFTVYEDRAATTGRTIDLNIAVFPAEAFSAEPDPLFLLAGGPGQAATEAFSGFIRFFEDVNQERDIVLVDQRGTGQSNPLQCANFVEEQFGSDFNDERVVELARTCRAEFQANLTLYTTEIAMADLDAVRAALGYEHVNLYGGAYGTRAALTYLRRYPEHVRTVTLDAVAGPELVLIMHFPRDAQRALDMLFERCAADQACYEQFPDLQAEFEALLATLEEPVELSVVHPLSGELVELTLTRDVFVSSVSNLLYFTDLVSLLPLLIHSAHMTGDFAPLIAQAIMLSEDVGLYYGMLFSVACAEDAPFISLDEAEQLREGTYFPLLAEIFLQVCAEWPQAEISADFRDPVVSDAPVLLLSGEADPVTPPSYAAQVAATLPNSLHLIAPDYGHGILAVGCVSDIVSDFVAMGTSIELDTSCLDGLQPPPFFVDLAGPRP